MSTTNIAISEMPAPAGLPVGKSKHVTWWGRGLTTLAALFLAMDAGVKLLMLPAAVDGTTALGFPKSMLVPIGVAELIFLALYLIPRTAVVGAVLWTGYLGGAVASKVRVDAPLFSDTLFPIYFAALLWLGLWLRDSRVAGMLARQVGR